jgi:hypothetical protein
MSCKNVQRRSFTIPSNETAIVRRYIVSYYIDRCELWRFIREINSGIFTCENISFFPPELLLHSYKCSGLRPLLCYSEYTCDCKLKKFHEMSLTTLAHNQHDVIDVI